MDDAWYELSIMREAQLARCDRAMVGIGNDVTALAVECAYQELFLSPKKDGVRCVAPGLRGYLSGFRLERVPGVRNGAARTRHSVKL